MVRITPLIAVLLLASSAAALELPERLRVRNCGGRCAWSCLETAANALGDDRLRGLTNLRGGLARDAHKTYDRGTTAKIADQLDALGVRYHLDPDYTFDHDTLRRYAKSRGVLVSLFKGSLYLEGRTLSECHAVLLVDYRDDGVQFYCPDNPWRIWRGDRRWFDASWTGSAVVILEPDP
jgi:hypothetical protein